MTFLFQPLAPYMYKGNAQTRQDEQQRHHQATAFGTRDMMMALLPNAQMFLDVVQASDVSFMFRDRIPRKERLLENS